MTQGQDDGAHGGPGQRGQRDPVVYDGVRLDLVDSLTAEILDRLEQAPASAPSLNKNGWRSDSLIAWPCRPARELLDTLRAMTNSPRIEAWAMVNRRGSWHPRHTHRGAVMAGVYYLHPGGPGSPPTIFEIAGGIEMCVDPAPGRLVVFPADVYHRVPEYHGDEPRVTVAFDVRA